MKLISSLILNILLILTLLYSEMRVNIYQTAYENSRTTLESFFRTVGKVDSNYECKTKTKYKNWMIVD